MNNITGASGEPLDRYIVHYGDGSKVEVFAEDVESAEYRAERLAVTNRTYVMAVYPS